MSALPKSLGQDVQQSPGFVSLNRLLLACRSDGKLANVRIKLFDACLDHLMRNAEITSTSASEICNLLQEELIVTTVSVKNLLELVQKCHQEIKENQVSESGNPIVKDGKKKISRLHQKYLLEDCLGKLPAKKGTHEYCTLHMCLALKLKSFGYRPS